MSFFFFFDFNDKKQMKGNKGEWSELYAFLRLLADGKLHGGDANMNVVQSKYFPIESVFRDDSPNRLEYRVDRLKNCISVLGLQHEITIPQEQLDKEAKGLLDFIHGIEGDKNTNTEIEDFVSRMGVNSLKAKSKDKADIRLVIHDLRTGTKPELGYSIKSQIGADSTLINSNKGQSNFIYEVEGLTKDQVEVFNSLEKFDKKFEYITEAGAKIHWIDASKNLLNNLKLLDYCMPQIISHCLLLKYSGKARYVCDISKILT